MCATGMCARANLRGNLALGCGPRGLIMSSHILTTSSTCKPLTVNWKDDVDAISELAVNPNKNPDGSRRI